ncbi:hypothetical protein M231_04357 [Tremella mesenterica]|uniref:Uncharacterized protein n=1 Tax=Tremella mesenterica TaxID=5217 RepID=A0A4Q1BKP0_TREME|nr:hypothetical protein M231_04357 [Tremella mesenterica]
MTSALFALSARYLDLLQVENGSLPSHFNVNLPSRSSTVILNKSHLRQSSTIVTTSTCRKLFRCSGELHKCFLVRDSLDHTIWNRITIEDMTGSTEKPSPDEASLNDTGSGIGSMSRSKGNVKSSRSIGERMFRLVMDNEKGARRDLISTLTVLQGLKDDLRMTSWIRSGGVFCGAQLKPAREFSMPLLPNTEPSAEEVGSVAFKHALEALVGHEVRTISVISYARMGMSIGDRESINIVPYSSSIRR